MRARLTDQSRDSYPHAVIPTLISPPLLHAVKAEILSHLSFTPKETDIYRLHQTGDLANLSGLPAELAAKLPSLRSLRDALYSKTFRDYVCGVTGCGALSGEKTDMAINVYTSGCHLLTHDDVIGSRRVSYILYLCGSEDEPWKPEWGGALRLYPTTTVEDGTKVPTADWTTVQPPAWNQLSFFEVVPGESFHDVEEVYDIPDGSERTRMAISGWFHIPQRGEDGFVEGLEEELGKKSSLASLQSKSEKYDRPQPQVVEYKDAHEEVFTPEEIDFLLKYIHPTYLTPDTLEELAEQFAEDSSVQISSFLRNTFEKALREYIEASDTKPSEWPVAVPPHKQKFLFLQPEAEKKAEEMTPVEELLNVLFPSREFQKLLQLATNMKLKSRNLLARRFRRGMDYTLATGLHSSSPAAIDGKADDDEDSPKMQLEITLSLTPTSGWEPPASPEEPKEGKKAKKSRLNPDHLEPEKEKRFDDSARTLGGYEMYMSAEDDDATNDPAVYQAAQNEDEDGVLFMNYPTWNCLNLALRDEGVLKFVKYISAKAEGDRWDLVGEFGVEEQEDGDEEQEDGDEEVVVNDEEEDDEEEDEGEDEEEDEEEEDTKKVVDDVHGSSDSEYDGKFDFDEEWEGCSP